MSADVFFYKLVVSLYIHIWISVVMLASTGSVNFIVSFNFVVFWEGPRVKSRKFKTIRFNSTEWDFGESVVCASFFCWSEEGKWLGERRNQSWWCQWAQNVGGHPTFTDSVSRFCFQTFFCHAEGYKQSWNVSILRLLLYSLLSLDFFWTMSQFYRFQKSLVRDGQLWIY